MSELALTPALTHHRGSYARWVMLLLAFTAGIPLDNLLGLAAILPSPGSYHSQRLTAPAIKLTQTRQQLKQVDKPLPTLPEQITLKDSPRVTNQLEGPFGLERFCQLQGRAIRTSFARAPPLA